MIGVACSAPCWATLIIGLYNSFFRFPVLLFSVPPSVVFGATVMTLIAAIAGAFAAVRRAVACPRGSHAAGSAGTLPPLVARNTIRPGNLGTAGRMVLRNVIRHPLRAAASVFGIAFAVAILMIGFVFTDAIDQLMQTQFWEAERQDVTVSFIEPRDEARATR